MHRKEALMLDIIEKERYDLLPKVLDDEDLKEWIQNLIDAGALPEGDYSDLDRAAIELEEMISSGEIDIDTVILTLPKSVRDMLAKMVRGAPVPKRSNLLKDIEAIRKWLIKQAAEKTGLEFLAPETKSPTEEMIEKGYLIDTITGEIIKPEDPVVFLPEGPAKKENWDRAVQLRKELKEKYPDILYSWHDVFEMVRKEKKP